MRCAAEAALKRAVVGRRTSACARRIVGKEALGEVREALAQDGIVGVGAQADTLECGERARHVRRGTHRRHGGQTGSRSGWARGTHTTRVQLVASR
eukprot:585157-Prymnesium_polylepis.1